MGGREEVGEGASAVGVGQSGWGQGGRESELESG